MSEWQDTDFDMPVICDDCGKWIELEDANFFIGCGCSSGCKHRICDECKTDKENYE